MVDDATERLRAFIAQPEVENEILRRKLEHVLHPRITLDQRSGFVVERTPTDEELRAEVEAEQRTTKRLQEAEQRGVDAAVKRYRQEKQRERPAPAAALQAPTAPPLAPVICLGSVVSEGKEDSAARRARRLKRFRELGGELRQAGQSWQSSGRRGALADLAREEAAAGRARKHYADVRRDLMKAMASSCD